MTACVARERYVSGGRFRGLASEAEVGSSRRASTAGRIIGRDVASARFTFRYKHPDRSQRIARGARQRSAARRIVEKAVMRGVVAAGITVSLRPATTGSFCRARRARRRTDTAARRRDKGTSTSPTTARGVELRDDSTPASTSPTAGAGDLGAAPAHCSRHAHAREGRAALPGAGACRGARRARLLREPVQTAAESAPASERHRSGRQPKQPRKSISPEYQHVDGTVRAAAINASVARRC